MSDFSAAFEAIDQFTARQMDEAGTPGLAIALTDHEYTLRVSTHGYADLAARTPVAPETLFEIGSIGKSFTAIALLQLAEAGRLDLHAPARRSLPWLELRSSFAPITLHHLLSHTAGITAGTDFTPSARYEVYALRETEAAYPPGERFYYSNVGYKALGYLLEDLLGHSYSEILRERILDPLGMSATDAITTHATRARLAVGHQRLYDDRPPRRADPLIPAPWLEYSAGDGSPAATAGDMAAYARMLLCHGDAPRGRILSEAGYALLTQRAVASGEGRFYGYGLYSEDIDGHLVIGHGGGTVGYGSVLLGDADAGLAVVVLGNGPVRAYTIGRFALAALRAAREGGPPPAAPASDDPTRCARAAEYAGEYHGSARALTLVAEGDRLLLRHAGAGVALEPRGEDAFLVDHPDFARHLLRFGRVGGRVVEAFYGPDWYPSAAYDGPAVFAAPAAWGAYAGHYRAHNPWLSNFRVLLRKGSLIFARPDGEEEPLVPRADGSFGVGETPERLRFDAVVGGRALRANLSGGDYYRQSPRGA